MNPITPLRFAAPRVLAAALTFGLLALALPALAGPHGHGSNGYVAAHGKHAGKHARPAPRPGIRKLRVEIRQTLDRLDSASATLERLAAERPTPRNRARVQRVTRDIRAMSRKLTRLNRRLARHLAHGPGSQQVVQVVHTPGYAPGPAPRPHLRPMSDREFRELTIRLEAEAFGHRRLNLLDDAVRAGARFDRSQARILMGLFTFDANKVEAASRACGAMVEPGALPALVAELTFESHRRELRERTGGYCGPPAA